MTVQALNFSPEESLQTEKKTLGSEINGNLRTNHLNLFLFFAFENIR